MRPDEDRNAIVTPSGDDTASGGGASDRLHQQWVMRSINELRDDMKESTRRIDNMHDKVSDQSNSFERMVGSLDRIELILRDQTKKTDDIDSSIKGLSSTISKAKDRIIGGIAVLAVVGGAIAYLFGEKLTVIAKAVMNLH